jgi:chromosome segregation ATPase
MSYAQAASDIRFLAARFKGFLAAAEALDKLGSLEGAINESQSRLAALKAQEAAQAAVINDRGTASVAEVARIITEAHESAAGIREQAEQHKTAANAEATNARESAAARAYEIIEDAQREAQKHHVQVKTARERLKEIEGKIEAALAHHADVEAKIVAATSEHDRIKAAKAAALATLAM